MIVSSILGWCVIAAGAFLSPTFLGENHARFQPEAVKNIDEFLRHEVVGQDFALNQLIAAVKNHITDPNPEQALVLSFHGPPGVGKSFTHQVLAKALYSRYPSGDLECPGRHCLGYKVVMGVELASVNEESNLTSTLESLQTHINEHDNSLIVLEEYDKMKCAGRRLFRFLVKNTDLKFRKSIILLESNAGFTEIVRLRKEAAIAAASKFSEFSSPPSLSDLLSPEVVEQSLKRSISTNWVSQNCESYVDTVRHLSLIGYFLPYMPLTWDDLQTLVLRDIERRWQKKKAVEAPVVCGRRVLQGRPDVEEASTKAGLGGLLNSIQKADAHASPCDKVLLVPSSDAVDWIVGKMDFGDMDDTGAAASEAKALVLKMTRFPLEGASQVPRKVTLYVQRHLDRLRLDPELFTIGKGKDLVFHIKVHPSGSALQLISPTTSAYQSSKGNTEL